MQRLDGQPHAGGARIGQQAGQTLQGTVAGEAQIPLAVLQSAGDGDQGARADRRRVIEQAPVVLQRRLPAQRSARREQAARAQCHRLHAVVGQHPRRRRGADGRQLVVPHRGEADPLPLQGRDAGGEVALETETHLVDAEFGQ